MRVCYRRRSEIAWINAHSFDDDEGDAHYRTPEAARRIKMDETIAHEYRILYE